MMVYSLARTTLLVFLVAVALNYPWELAQAPLYDGLNDRSAAIWHCFVASLGDGLLMLLIFAAGLGVFRRLDWFERPGARGYLLMFATGMAIALVVEWAAVHLAHRWSYANAMPRLPGLDIGIVPVIQMLILPPLVFCVVRVILRWKG